MKSQSKINKKLIIIILVIIISMLSFLFTSSQSEYFKSNTVSFQFTITSDEVEDENEVEDEANTGTGLFNNNKNTTKCSHPFNDIENHWAENYICTAFELKIINGVNSKQFKPDQLITRAESIKIILNAYNYQTPSSVTNSAFTDISILNWYAPYLWIAYQEQIIIGYPDGTFKPNKSINNSEAMKILIKPKVNKSLESLKSLISLLAISNDNIKKLSLNKWYSYYMAYAYEKGIINISSNSKFDLHKKVTRAEFTRMVILMTQQN